MCGPVDPGGPGQAVAPRMHRDLLWKDKKKSMPAAYDLAGMLEEIVEDEKISSVKSARVTQDQLKEMFLGKHGGTGQQEISARPLGEALLDRGVISRDALNKALKIQAEKGGEIDSILVDLGHVSDKALLGFLADRYGVRSINLFELNLDESTMGLLPSRIVLKHKVIPIKTDKNSISLGMASPDDARAVNEVEFFTGKKVIPVAVPPYQMSLVVKHVEERGRSCFSGEELRQTSKASSTIKALLEHLASSNASDLILSPGSVPFIRLNTVLRRTNLQVLSESDCTAHARGLMTEEQWERLQADRELRFSMDYENIGRFRITVYRQRGGLSITIRRINTNDHSMDSLGLPSWLAEYAMQPRGLVLFASPAGHGKSSTMAAAVDLINGKRVCNVITLEEPVEYRYPCRKSAVNQREIGKDALSFAEGMRNICRQSPDVIVIDEIRDSVTFETAVRAASTGCLVLGAVHGSGSVSVMEQLLDTLPPNRRKYVLHQLADALLLVFSQKLVPAERASSVVAAYEKLTNSTRVGTLIREDRLCEIRGSGSSETDDFLSMDACLNRYGKEGKLPHPAAARSAGKAVSTGGKQSRSGRSEK